MKKIFLALTFFAFIGGTTVATANVLAGNDVPTSVVEGEKEKDKKKKKKKKKKGDATATGKSCGASSSCCKKKDPS